MKLDGVILAVLSALFMGTMGVFSRKTGFDAELITFFRLFFGALFLMTLLATVGKLRLLATWPSWPVLINGSMLAGFIIFYVQAMNLTTMANSIMMLYLAPLAASIFAHFFLGESLRLVNLLLICCALFGFAMMMEFSLDFSSGSNHALGLGYAFLGMLCYAAFILINRIIDDSIHVYTRTCFQLLVGALCMVPFLIGELPEISPVNWLWSIGAGFIPGFLGILCAVVALKKLPAATFGTLAYFEPIFVVFLGWTIFGETLSPMQLSGCAIILASGAITGYLVATERPALQNRTTKQ